MSSSSFAYVTTVLNENEAVGAMVLGQSIRQVSTNTDAKLCCLIARESVSHQSTLVLARIYDLVIPLSPDQPILENRYDLIQASLGLLCWKQLDQQFSKCVYIAPTCLVLSDISELFARDELSAAPDTRWPDNFNSGVFVFRPSQTTYKALLQKLFDQPNLAHSPILGSTGADLSQSCESVHNLLNSFFGQWAHDDIRKHLPFIYNVTPTIFYTYQPALANFRENLKIIQFSAPKPWTTSYDVGSGEVTNVQPAQQAVYGHWWTLFNTHVKPLLAQQNIDYVHTYQTISTTTGQCHHQNQANEQQSLPKDNNRERTEWEEGRADFMGRDSFENIKEALDKSMN